MKKIIFALCAAGFLVFLLIPTSLIADDDRTARVFSLADLSRVAGARGTITRSDTEICLGVETWDLPPGVYTGEAP